MANETIIFQFIGHFYIMNIILGEINLNLTEIWLIFQKW